MSNQASNTTASPPTRRRFNRQILGAAALAACGAGAAGAWWFSQSKRQPRNIPMLGFEVVKEFPHDSKAFTQGLVFDGGYFYESTGNYGKSSLRKVEIATGKVLEQVNLDEKYFGEGLALAGDELFQLTWQEGVAFVYDRATFKLKRQHRFESEGWGLTFDGKLFIHSDGTSTLRFLDPKTFRVARRVTVRMGKDRVEELNELEYINGEVWANIWHEDGIIRIDPETGKVTNYIDLRSLWPAKDRPDREDVLNGIAYDPKDKRLFVTGKHWPKIYEIRIVAG